MRRLAVLISLGAGCGGPPEPAPEPDADRASTTTEWVYDADTTAAVGVDLAVLEADLQAQIDRVPSWNGAPLKASYAAAAAHGDRTCPPQEGLDDAVTGRSTWWYGACMTGTRVHFNGVMTRWDWEGHGVEATQVVDIAGRLPEGYAYTGGGFEGRIDIYDEAGRIDFGCSCQGMTGSGIAEDGSTLAFSFARGPATWTGGEAADSWLLTPEIRPWVWQLYTTLPAENARTARVELALSGVGARYKTSQLDIDVRSDPTDGTCSEARVSGLVRDSRDASWIVVEATQRATGECVTCFPVADAGEVCLALDVLRDADLDVAEPNAW